MARKKSKGNLASGSYRVRVFVGYRADGSRRYESFTDPDPDVAKADASSFKLRMKRMLAQGIPVDDIPRDDAQVTPKANTVEYYLEAYLDTCRTIGLSPSSLLGYQRIVKRAYSQIRSISAAALTIADIQGYVNARAAANASTKTIRCELSLLACALRQVRPDLNMRLIRLPKQRRHEMEIPSTEQVQILINDARGTDMYLPILMAAILGMRRSEICGLKWSDVDLKRNTIHIHSAIVRGENGAYETKGTKTDAGDRTIPIPASLVPAFRQARTLGPMVTTLTPDAITRRYERMTQRLGIPGRFHDLRHYHASVMIAAGAPNKYICADMGHASMEMVNRVYGHVMRDKQQEIHEEMEARAAVFTL